MTPFRRSRSCWSPRAGAGRLRRPARPRDRHDRQGLATTAEVAAVYDALPPGAQRRHRAARPQAAVDHRDRARAGDRLRARSRCRSGSTPTQKADTGEVEILDIQTPRFTKYPLWYFAVVRDGSRDVKRVQVFERASAVDPWLLVTTPETLADTELPEIRSDGRGDARAVQADDGAGMAMSPQEAADGVRGQTLADPKADEAADIEDDSFIEQMRAAAAANAALKGVTFAQPWEARAGPVRAAHHDGGALAFVTLLRTDTYTVQDGLQVTWPDGLAPAGLPAGRHPGHRHAELLPPGAASTCPAATASRGRSASSAASSAATAGDRLGDAVRPLVLGELGLLRLLRAPRGRPASSPASTASSSSIAAAVARSRTVAGIAPVHGLDLGGLQRHPLGDTSCRRCRGRTGRCRRRPSRATPAAS